MSSGETECVTSTGSVQGMHYSEPDARGCLKALVVLGGEATSGEIRRHHNREAIHTSISMLREFLRREGYKGETCPCVWKRRPGDSRKRPVYCLRADVLQGLPAEHVAVSGQQSATEEEKPYPIKVRKPGDPPDYGQERTQLRLIDVRSRFKD